MIEEERVTFLSTSSRKVLVVAICDFIQLNYGENYSYNDISDVCKAAIEVFPSQKVEPSEIEGIVSSIDYFVILIL